MFRLNGPASLRRTPGGAPRKLLRLVVGPLSVLAVAASCSSGDDSTAPEVATLETSDAAVGDAADAATIDDEPELAPDEAALEFSACMREQGLDFPDLGVDAEGNIDLRSAFQSFDRQSEEFPAAMEACRSILADSGFGGGPRQAMQSTEMQDALVNFSACVRDAGYDVGDITIPGPGQRPGAADGDGDGNARNDGVDAEGNGDAEESEAGGPGGGQRRGGFGNINERLANGLGLDYEDPDVQSTVDDCSVIIQEALAAVGLPGPGNETSADADE